jgi:hypothetical protein
MPMTEHPFRHDGAYLDFMRHFIVDAIKTLGRARPRDLERCFQEAFGRRVCDDTLKRYADILVDEGILRREPIVDNAGSERRRYRMTWYLLK